MVTEAPGYKVFDPGCTWDIVGALNWVALIWAKWNSFLVFWNCERKSSKDKVPRIKSSPWDSEVSSIDWAFSDRYCDKLWGEYFDFIVSCNLVCVFCCSLVCSSFCLNTLTSS